jgi:hypothetical protein
MLALRQGAPAGASALATSRQCSTDILGGAVHGIRLGVLIAVAVSTGVVARDVLASAPVRRHLIGRWELVSVEVLQGGQVEYPLGQDVSGVPSYDVSGRMAVQIMQANRPRYASGNQGNGSPGERAAAVSGYVAYFGTFSVDEAGQVVTHHVTGTSSRTRSVRTNSGW